MKTIVLTHTDEKQLDALPSRDREAVTDALDDFAIHGLGDVKKLQGRAGSRLRVGNYRVIFDEDETIILGVYVGRRKTTTYRRP